MQKKNHPGSRKKKTQAAVNESYLQTVFRRFRKHRLALVSFIVLVALVGAALLAPWIAPYDPNAIVGPFSGAPTLQNWLGTDQIGRDVLSRLLYAMRISLLVGALATLISTVIGVVLGLIAGYFGGIADMLIMRFTGYGHVLSIHPARARGGSDLPSRPLEHHFDSRLRRLAGYRPPCARQRAQPARDELCKG